MPRSPTLTRESAGIRIFSGFRSRWRMPLECRCVRASPTWRRIERAWAAGIGWPGVMNRRRSPPSMYSVTRNGSPESLVVPKSKIERMWGCETLARSSASRLKRVRHRSASSPSGIERTFTQTGRFSASCLAR